MTDSRIVLKRRSRIETITLKRDLRGRVIKTEKREYIVSAKGIDFFTNLKEFFIKHQNEDTDLHSCPHSLYIEYAEFKYSYGDSQPFKSKDFDISGYYEYLDAWDGYIRPIIGSLP
jgi:hypothetical protein